MLPRALPALLSLALLACLSGAGAEHGQVGPPTPHADGTYGDLHAGQYHLGPVDFAETKYHNACAPLHGYVSSLQAATGLGGEYLAGVASPLAQGGGICDACIEIKAANGHGLVARVVTYGTEAAAGDIDVSPSAFAVLNTGEYPRSMTWQLARCPDEGGLAFEFQSASSQWWTSLWVRNPRVPILTVEVRSARHASFTALARGSDGTLTDLDGFGAGPFTLRVTAVDGQVITQDFDAIPAGQVIATARQFQ